MTDYLLTEDEMEQAIGGEFVDDPLLILDFQSACEAQDRKSRRLMLEQLEKEGLLHHSAMPIFDNGIIVGWECTKDCRACAALREVGA